MPRFPRREPEMILLAEEMLKGLKAWPAHFPGSDAHGLESLLALYNRRKDTQTSALEAYKKATDAKDQALMELVRKMKEELRRAEEATGGDESRLERIGWGGASEVTMTPPPGQPRDLEILPQAGPTGRILLRWKSPQRGQGGPVVLYEIERYVGVNGTGDHPWGLVATSFDTEILLSEQPNGVPLHYRIVAKNQQGPSLPSNTVQMAL